MVIFVGQTRRTETSAPCEDMTIITSYTADS